MEVQAIFDRYVEGSLKEKARKIGRNYIAATSAGHVVPRWHVNQYDIIETTVSARPRSTI